MYQVPKIKAYKSHGDDRRSAPYVVSIFSLPLSFSVTNKLTRSHAKPDVMLWAILTIDQAMQGLYNLSSDP
jgi:hypothetical protein